VSTQPKIWTVIAALCCTAGIAVAQQAGAPDTAPSVKSTPQDEAGEPRADTSSPQAAASDQSSPTPATGTTPAAGPAPSAGPAPAGAPAKGSVPSPTRPVPPGASSGHPGSGATAAARKSATKVDRLELGTATVTGDREQPKVMYIVPWKRSDIGDLAGKPMNSLVDEILAPVDRDVFKREVVYYQAVQADVSQNGAQPKAAPQGEK
jgi:hypothetical protein